MKAIPKSTQNTIQDGDAPMPLVANALSRAIGTPFARVTPE